MPLTAADKTVRKSEGKRLQLQPRRLRQACSESERLEVLLAVTAAVIVALAVLVLAAAGLVVVPVLRKGGGVRNRPALPQPLGRVLSQSV